MGWGEDPACLCSLQCGGTGWDSVPRAARGSQAGATYELQSTSPSLPSAAHTLAETNGNWILWLQVYSPSGRASELASAVGSLERTACGSGLGSRFFPLSLGWRQ